MRILLTGAAGFWGQHIINRLAAEKVSIRAIVRPNSDTEHLDYSKLEFMVGDLRDEAVIKKAIKNVDVIIHAASSRGGTWQTIHADNVQTTELLLKHSLKNRIKRFIFISTVMVYDHTRTESGTVLNEDYPYEEKNLNYFSKSKIEAEKIVKHYHEHYDLPAVVLRAAGLYGIGGGLYPPHLGMSVGENLYVLMDRPGTSFPLTHVNSLAEATWLCIKNKASIGKFYNVVEDRTVTRRDYLQILKQKYHPKLRMVYIPYFFFKGADFVISKLSALVGRQSPIRPLQFKMSAYDYIYCSGRLKNELDWHPVANLKQAIADVIEWHRAEHVPKRLFPKSVHEEISLSGKTLRVGIIGCGQRADAHLAVISKMKYVTSVALCDINKEAVVRLAQKYNIHKRYTDYAEMLRDEQLDVVHVLTNPQIHADISILAAKTGRHILVEKPMCINSAEAKKMIKAAHDNHVKLCVAHNWLFDDVMVQVRKILANGVLGKIVHVENWFGSSFSTNRNDYYLTFEGRNHWVYDLPGSMYQNVISHPLSVLMDVMGTCTHVKASAAYLKVVPYMKTDELRTIIESDGCVGILSISFAAAPHYNYMRVYGTRASLEVDFVNKFTFVDQALPVNPSAAGRDVRMMKKAGRLFWYSVRNGLNAVRGRSRSMDGTEKLIQLFYWSILFNETVPVTGEEGLQSMEIMELIWRQVQV
jgi:predicted dehydrogenase/nucleoside-diphosphate-sugar epimerase